MNSSENQKSSSEVSLLSPKSSSKPLIMRSKNIKRKKVVIKRKSPFELFPPKINIPEPPPKPISTLSNTLLANSKEAWKKIFKVHGGASRIGVLNSFSAFTTFEYEMPQEDESLKEFRKRVPNPKLRCRSC